MIYLLETGAGFWNPLVWLLSLFIIVLLVYFVRCFGEKKYNSGIEQTTSFYSGNTPPNLPIKCNNIYWGFFKALDKYYKVLMNIHTGLVSDYVSWFILTIVLGLIVLTIGDLLW
jgi:hypothetical protein